MGIVTVVGGVFDVSSRDSDTTLALLGGLVNGTVLEEVGQTLGSLVLGDSSGQSGLIEDIVCEPESSHVFLSLYGGEECFANLSVVDVTNSTY